MDGRTRVRNAIARKPIDRIPMYDSFWEDTLSTWREQGFPEDANPDDFFDWDIRMMYIDASMQLDQRILKEDSESVVFQDRAGYTARKLVGKSRALEWIEHATKDKDAWKSLKRGFDFDPTDTARIDSRSYFAHMAPYPSWEEAKVLYDELRATGKYIMFTVYGPWEATWRHRGYTELMMDLAMDPDWVREMAETQVETVLACLRHCAQLGMKPDGLFLIDDLACTRGPLFAPKTWRAIFKPLYERLGHYLKEQDAHFLLHCCGNCETFIPDLIDCGLDVLQPLQAQAGMDVGSLKEHYGEDLAYWGNIDVHKMSASWDECEAEVREKVLAGKEGGGYLYHSDHSVPPEVDFERYQWIINLVRECGAY